MQSSKTMALASLAVLVMLTACSVQPFDSESVNSYRLEVSSSETPVAGSGPAILVSEPSTLPAFRSRAMVYQEQPFELETFARNQWTAPPAQMVAPLLRRAMRESGGFSAVVDSGSGVSARLRLDTEILDFHQSFLHRPSRMIIEVRAAVLDTVAREQLLVRTYRRELETPSDDPYGGVQAANRLVLEMLATLAQDVAAVAREMDQA